MLTHSPLSVWVDGRASMFYCQIMSSTCVLNLLFIEPVADRSSEIGQRCTITRSLEQLTGPADHTHAHFDGVY